MDTVSKKKQSSYLINVVHSFLDLIIVLVQWSGCEKIMTSPWTISGTSLWPLRPLSPRHCLKENHQSCRQICKWLAVWLLWKWLVWLLPADAKMTGRGMTFPGQVFGSSQLQGQQYDVFASTTIYTFRPYLTGFCGICSLKLHLPLKATNCSSTVTWKE